MNSGAFGENFPYSNFHDLNMDWIIKIAKDFLDQYTHIQEVIEEGEQSLQDLTTSGLEQLQTKADDLEALLQQWYNTHSEDIADQLADALADLNEWYTQHQGYLESYLASSITAFGEAADLKASQTLASIPSDYTSLANTVTKLNDSLIPVFNIPIIPNKYLTTTGSEGLLNSDTGNGFELDVIPGTIIVYTGNAYWNPVYGYDSNGNATPLIESSTAVDLTDYEVLIDNPNIVNIKGWGLNTGTPLSVKLKGLSSQLLKLLKTDEEGVYTTGWYITPTGLIASGDGGSGNTICEFNDISVGDSFEYTGFYPSYSWGLVWGYDANNTPTKLLEGRCGNWNTENMYTNRLITITDPSIIKVVAWSETLDSNLHLQNIPFSFKRSTKTPLANKRSFTVDKQGNGDFTFLEDAIYTLREMFDEDTDIHLNIHNGIYNVKGINEHGYYGIDKGVNGISMHGQNKELCIIQWVNTDTTRNAVLNIGGSCVIENLTIKQVYAGNPSGITFNGNAYGIHNDTAYKNDAPSDWYYTVVRNCYIESNMFNPVGAGLRGLQHQVYDHVECVDTTNIDLYKQWGAIYVHAPANHDVTLCDLTINDCIMRTTRDIMTLSLPNVSGSLQYTSIPVTICRSIGYTPNSITTDVSVATHALTRWSALNNITDWNR